MKTDKIVKTYKYRIYPNNEQIDLFNKTLGCTRFIWNRILDITIKEYEFYLANKDISLITPVVKPVITGFNLVNKLIGLKSNPEYIWLNKVSSVALQQKLFDLNDAFSNFFKSRKGYPKFKKKSNTQSFRLMTNGFRFKEKELYLSKCDTPIKIKWSRDLPNPPSSVTVSKNAAGQYHVCFVCEYIPVKTNGTEQIGIDLGLKDFLAISTGEKIENPKHYLRSQKRLARLQKKHSKKKKGSKNRNKSRCKIAKLHLKISNQRNDFLHKLSTKLVNENQVISLESLKPANMVKNHKLAKSISDASWGIFVQFLKYKAKDSQNCKLIFMDQYFPSTHICSKCFTKLSTKLKLSDRTWKCPHCGTKHDRDTNAANVIDITGKYCLHLIPNECHVAIARTFDQLVDAGLFTLVTS